MFMKAIVESVVPYGTADVFGHLQGPLSNKLVDQEP